MDRGDILLQGLLHNLEKWIHVITRGTHTTVTILPVPGNGFILRAAWINGIGHEQHFSKEYCFGSSYRLSPQAWQIEKKACDHAREFMRTILEKRGVA